MDNAFLRLSYEAELITFSSTYGWWTDSFLTCAISVFTILFDSKWSTFELISFSISDSTLLILIFSNEAHDLI